MKKKMPYNKMLEVLQDNIPLTDTDDDGRAWKLVLLPGKKIFRVRDPEWDEDTKK